MKDYKHEYIITSERGFWDETDITLYTDAEHKECDWIELDGIQWMIMEVVK